MQPNEDEQNLSTRVIEAMMKLDAVAQGLGVTLLAIQPGYAQLSITVRNDMLNGLGLCHGGITFSLADTAFAYACNSRNRKTVALACNINYCASATEGDVLTATAKELSLQGRTGVCDVTITNQTDVTVAYFRGTSYATSSPVIELG